MDVEKMTEVLRMVQESLVDGSYGQMEVDIIGVTSDALVLQQQEIERIRGELEKIKGGNIIMVCKKCLSLCTAKCGDNDKAMSICCDNDITYFDKRVEYVPKAPEVG